MSITNFDEIWNKKCNFQKNIWLVPFVIKITLKLKVSDVFSMFRLVLGFI